MNISHVAVWILCDLRLVLCIGYLHNKIHKTCMTVVMFVARTFCHCGRITFVKTSRNLIISSQDLKMVSRKARIEQGQAGVFFLYLSLSGVLV